MDRRADGACGRLRRRPRARRRGRGGDQRGDQGFIDTREANDVAGVIALLTADVDQQQTSGNVRRGRDAVVSGSLATQQSTGGKRTITVQSIRFVTVDVAIADGRYDSLGRADGSDRHMLTSMVLRRESGGWKIAAIRNSLPTSPDAEK